MAGLYIFLSLVTAVIFILSRECKVSIIKKQFLVIRVDLTFFALTLYNREKSKSKKKQGSTPELKRKIYNRLIKLLSYARIEVKRLSISVFPAPDSPSALPFASANSAINYLLVGYLASLAKEVSISGDGKADDSLYHLILRTPLFRLLYTVIALRLDIFKDKRKMRLAYVGNKNG